MNDNDSPVTDGHLDPAESLALIDASRHHTQSSVEPSGAFLYSIWGLAYLIGFGLLFSRFGGPDGSADPLLALPSAVVWAGFGLSLAAAAVTTTVHSIRRMAGVAGPSQEVGALYGWAWCLAFVLATPVAAAIGRNLPDDVSYSLTSGLYVHVAGVLYMMSGAVWRDRSQFVLGVWVSVASAVGLTIGPRWHALVIALLAGGGMLVAGALAAHRTRRATPETLR